MPSLRMTPAFLNILLAVLQRPQHGYAIMQEVEERTGGSVALGPGSLYWSIKRLVDVGYLEEVDTADRRRRLYALTDEGRDVLKREVRVLADIVGYAESQRLFSE